MIKFKKTLWSLFVACAILFPDQGNATITISTGTTYQSLEGIGTIGNMPALYQKAGPVFYISKPSGWELDRYAVDLGASGVRYLLSIGSLYPSAGTYDWDGTLSGTGGINPTVAAMRPLVSRGITKYLISILSPPGWMKTNGSEINGGVLLSEYYGDFANFLALYCKKLKDSIGVEPYALSVQNEPAFAEPYPSCTYNSTQLAQMVDLTATALTAQGLTTKLIGPEDVFGNGGLSNWANFVTEPNIWGYAGHGNASWSSAGTYVGSKKLWMSEWDDAGGATTDFLTHSEDLINALNANLSWWTWLGLDGDLGTYLADANGVDTAFKPNAYYYATKHFARFIRPGAVRIGCTQDGSVMATAFKNPDNTIAVVMANTGTGTVTETVSGAGLPTTFQVYQTAAAPNYCVLGTAYTVGGAGISLPAGSVTSIISGSPVPVVEADSVPDSVGAPTSDATVGQLNYFGDDTDEVYVNGHRINMPSAAKGNVQLNAGQNVIAVKLTNLAWGGGFIAGMLLPGGDTLKTDGTWKITIKQPDSATWTSATFDDSQWDLSHVMGPVTIWPGFASWGMQAVNLYYLKSSWISGAVKSYMRKNVTLTAGSLGFSMTGNNVDYTIYLDGVALRTGTELANCGSSACMTTVGKIQFTHTVTAGSHCLGIELTDASTNGNGVLYKFQYGNNHLDTTWTCWTDTTGATGWSTTAFNDASWVHPNNIDAYDPTGMAGSFIYPGVFWFRKVFTSKGATNAIFSLVKNRAFQVTNVTYYDLMGHKIPKTQILRNHNGMILQKIDRGNAQSAIMAKVNVQ